MSDDMQTGLIILAGLGFFVFAVVMAIVQANKKRKIKKWGLANNLSYLKKRKLGMLRLDSTIIRDIMWGELNGKRVYLFLETYNEGRSATSISFINGKFYPFVDIEAAQTIIQGGDTSTIESGVVFDKGSNVEQVEALMAHYYLKMGQIMEYETMREIFDLMRDYYGSKASFKDKLVKAFSRLKNGKIKYNSSEGKEYVMRNMKKKIERKVVDDVADLYQGLLAEYNKGEMGV